MPLNGRNMNSIGLPTMMAVYNQLRLYIMRPIPIRLLLEYYQDYVIRCSEIAQAQGDFPRLFSWNAATNQAYDYWDYGDAGGDFNRNPRRQLQFVDSNRYMHCRSKG